MKKFFISLLLLSAALIAAAEDGFMSEKWNQAEPWNDFMPVFSSEAGASNDGLQGYNRRAPAGCVAIQMSQFLHYWQWPKTYWNLSETTHGVTQTYGKEPYKYSITLKPNGRVPFDYSNNGDSMARLAFVCASLANMGFTSSGSGSLPETVINKLVNSDYYESKGSVIKDSDTMRKYLKAGYPLLARGEGHAYILHDWQDDSKTPVYANWGWQGGKGNEWKALSQIDEIFLCYPKIMPRIDSVPTQSKRPLTITWGFPEMYCSIYADIFDGFYVNIVPTRSTIKDDPGKTTKVGKTVRSFTFSSNDLENSKEYRVTVTPIFKGETLSTVYSHSVEFTISDSASESPKILSLPESIRVKLRKFSFQVTCSDAVKSLDVSSSVYSISLNNEIYCFDFDNLTCSKNGNVYTITMNAGILPQQFEDQRLILTLKANGAMSEDYADVIVTLIPNDGEESITEGSGTDSGTEGTDTDPTNFVTDSDGADYILISPADFVKDWTAYVKARAKAHPELKFAIKNAAEIYTEYGDKGGNPADMIKSYIALKAENGKGAKYFVLGAAWSDISSMDGKSETSFLIESKSIKDSKEKEYKFESLTLSNTIPGFYHDYRPTKPDLIASDYDYSLISEGDKIPSVVVARIPLVRWADDNETSPTFEQLIVGYGNKVAKVEKDFSGRHHYACAGGPLSQNGKTPLVYRTDDFYPNERFKYGDGYLELFDPNHPDPTYDGEIAARRRFKEFFSKNNPVYKGAYLPLGMKADSFFADHDGWEAVIAKTHGLEYESCNTDINYAHFKNTETLIKFGIFALPCLTGRPDWTQILIAGDNKVKVLKPSMGIAAICNTRGGEVVGFHNTYDGAGQYGANLTSTNSDLWSTEYEGFLLAALCERDADNNTLNAGEAWLKAHCDLINKNSSTWYMYVAQESILYGDPLIKVSSIKEGEKVCGSGALPAKVLFR